MTKALRRYEFSERLARLIGASRRDLRFRVTLMVTSGLIPPGPRGPGAPPATPEYAAKLLIGAMAAPQQTDTVEAIRCYSALRPTVRAAEATSPSITVGTPRAEPWREEPPELPLLADSPLFAEALTRLLERARGAETRAALAGELFGVWLSRGFPAAAVQLAAWSGGRRNLINQRYEAPEGARPPAWLDPERGGVADPGLFHSVFLPVNKLIAIGALTTVADERKPHMINLGPNFNPEFRRFANLAQMKRLMELAQQRRHRGSWEKLLTLLANAEAWAKKVDIGQTRLVEVPDFGSNPGNLRMFKYLPQNLPASAPMVVLLHGCTQTGAVYDRGTGWSTLADRFGFALLLPEQRGTNNPLRCFNWFRAEDSERDRGEPLSIKQMIDCMIADHGIDRDRVHVTGLSAGGAMTSVMLATYPDVFVGGAILAGVPYRSARGLQEAFETIFQGRVRAAAQWGDLVRWASPHQGPWPKISVWHGDADTSVKPVNAEEIVKQWTDVHAVASAPLIEQRVSGNLRRVWHDAGGNQVVEAYTIAGMAHGAPVEPGELEHQCGTAAPFFHDVGIASTYHIASFWGLTERRVAPESVAAGRPAATPPAGAVEEVPVAVPRPTTTPVIWVDSAGRARPAADSRRDRGPVQDQADGAGRRSAAGVDVGSIITQSLEMANRLAGGRTGDSRRRTGEDTSQPGIDVQGIVSQALETVGVLGGDRAGAAKTGGSGIDVAEIIARSLEAAGVLAARGQDGRGDSGPSPSGRPEPTAAAGTQGGGRLAGWSHEGWEVVEDDPTAPGPGPVLFARALAGTTGVAGKDTRTLSRRWQLGPRPRLTYVRRLDLKADANLVTTANFEVRVNGVLVDEVAVVGMRHVEQGWIERSHINLGRFAGQAVTLSFTVAASSNVSQEVVATAWLTGIDVRDALATEALAEAL